MSDSTEYTISLRPFGSKKIYLDPGEAEGIYLYHSEVKSLKLEEGMRISREDFEEIRKTFALPRAKRYLMHILCKQDQTVKQLEEKLARAGNDAVSIRLALDYAGEQGFTDDARYASDYLSSRRGRKSFKAIRQDLKVKGISGEIIGLLFEAEDQTVEDLLPQMERYAGKFPELDGKARNKIYAHFYRKGYGSSLIMETLSAVTREKDKSIGF
ncbi:MAG: regulatory protein RecX [Eubacterium sp.]|nr:regulatory protein RecX [Eubacterium sp.]